VSLLALLLAPAALSGEVVDFDHHPAGSSPPGWVATKTGKGEAKWEVVADPSAPTPPNVLKQSGEATFPLCIQEKTELKDGFVEVKFNALSGRVDQAGGLIWRCRDADNYYIARANALENNVTIYHTIQGKRVSFKNVDLKVLPGVWHTLRVDFAGNKFAVSFNGKVVLEATDDHFAEAGKVGLWTKADSVTVFDDFRYGTKE
jgi:hypothetical protein